MLDVLTSRRIQELSRDENLKRPKPNLVVVHPFYKGDDPAHYIVRKQGRENVLNSVIPQGNYLENLQKLTEGHQGRIILFEEKSSLEASAVKIRGEGVEDLFVIVTEYGCGKPEDLSERETFEFICNLGGEIAFAGGCLWDAPPARISNRYEGCLGYVVRQVLNRRIEGAFVPGCIFN